jgi:hypothetical protein
MVACKPTSRRAVDPPSRRADEPTSRRADEPTSRRADEPTSRRAGRGRSVVCEAGDVSKVFRHDHIDIVRVKRGYPWKLTA